jgi:hypothetical protein
MVLLIRIADTTAPGVSASDERVAVIQQEKFAGEQPRRMPPYALLSFALIAALKPPSGAIFAHCFLI